MVDNSNHMNDAARNHYRFRGHYRAVENVRQESVKESKYPVRMGCRQPTANFIQCREVLQAKLLALSFSLSGKPATDSLRFCAIRSVLRAVFVCKCIYIYIYVRVSLSICM